MRLEDWNNGEPCEDDQMSFCERCKPHPYPETVYVTGGGSAFHKDRRCDAMESGQRHVVARGGSPSEITAVGIQVALGREGREPCQRCFPVRSG